LFSPLKLIFIALPIVGYPAISYEYQAIGKAIQLIPSITRQKLVVKRFSSDKNTNMVAYDR
jgi:hypothetical protein